MISSISKFYRATHRSSIVESKIALELQIEKLVFPTGTKFPESTNFYVGVERSKHHSYSSMKSANIAARTGQITFNEVLSVGATMYLDKGKFLEKTATILIKQIVGVDPLKSSEVASFQIHIEEFMTASEKSQIVKSFTYQGVEDCQLYFYIHVNHSPPSDQMEVYSGHFESTSTTTSQHASTSPPITPGSETEDPDQVRLSEDWNRDSIVDIAEELERTKDNLEAALLSAVEKAKFEQMYTASQSQLASTFESLENEQHLNLELEQKLLSSTTEFSMLSESYSVLERERDNLNGQVQTLSQLVTNQTHTIQILKEENELQHQSLLDAEAKLEASELDLSSSLDKLKEAQNTLLSLLGPAQTDPDLKSQLNALALELQSATTSVKETEEEVQRTHNAMVQRDEETQVSLKEYQSKDEELQVSISEISRLKAELSEQTRLHQEAINVQAEANSNLLQEKRDLQLSLDLCHSKHEKELQELTQQIELLSVSTLNTPVLPAPVPSALESDSQLVASPSPSPLPSSSSTSHPTSLPTAPQDQQLIFNGSSFRTNLAMFSLGGLVALLATTSGPVLNKALARKH